MVKYLLAVFALLISMQSYAQDIPFDFDSAEQELRYKKLIEEIRCLVCQNQSLADSNAELAQDLREEVYGQMNKGLSNQDIISFLVARYGDFVMYRPPLKKSTWLLWFGPFILLLIGVVVVIRLIKTNTSQAQNILSQQDKEKVQALLQNSDNEGK